MLTFNKVLLGNDIQMNKPPVCFHKRFATPVYQSLSEIILRLENARKKIDESSKRINTPYS